MSEISKIIHKIEQLREYLKYLQNYQTYSQKEISEDFTLRAAVERYFHLSIECVIDISYMIISDLKLKRPANYRHSIDLLGEQGVIPDEFAYYFAPITGFRNILVHEYAEIDFNLVYKHLQNDLKDLEKFCQYVVQFLNKENQG